MHLLLMGLLITTLNVSPINPIFMVDSTKGYVQTNPNDIPLHTRMYVERYEWTGKELILYSHIGVIRSHKDD